jgi:DNA replication licensing factor MCM6
MQKWFTLIACTGVTRSSWRITVRQLESMIRLSEAMAKMACSDEVLPKHVQEAFRLLNKSIIRVETPDIDFEDKPVEQDVEGGVVNGAHAAEAGDGDPQTNGTSNEEGEKKPPAPTSKVKVTYEEYKTIANLLILYLRQNEDVDDGN